MKEIVKMNDKQIESIKDYLEKRFGTYGVAGDELKIAETPRYSYDYLISQELPKNVLGIFQHTLRKCFLNVEVWGSEKKSEEVYRRHYVRCGLSYEQFDGNSNGCNMNIEFWIYENGKIEEIYK